MNKFGDLAQKSVFYLIFGVVLTVMFFMLVYIISGYISLSQQISPDLIEKMYIERFVSSPYCFVLQDADTGRAYPGIIDVKKFSKFNLDYCYESFSNGYKKVSILESMSSPSAGVSVKSGSIFRSTIPFRITLSVGGASSSVQTDDWNNKVVKSFVRKVLVSVDGVLKNGELKFEVATLE